MKYIYIVFYYIFSSKIVILIIFMSLFSIFNLANLKSIKNVYIHLPFCIQKCHFCAFPIHAIGRQYDIQHLQNYTNYLLRQIDYYNLQYAQPLQSLYLGGGTPSLMSKNSLQKILKKFKINTDTETTIEMMPSELKDLNKFRQLGFNRFSIGLQTTNQTILKNLNRIQWDRQQTMKILKQMKSINYNLDFIIGINETKSDQQQIINIIKYLQPPQITLYMIQINEGSFIHKKGLTQNNGLSSNQVLIQRYKQFCKFFKTINYNHYEISCFFKTNPPVHNQVYWKGNHQFAAFGMGATSLLSNKRFNRPNNLNKYYKYVQQLPNFNYPFEDQSIENEKLKSILMSRLRTVNGINYKDIQKQFGYQLTSKIKYFINELRILNPKLFADNDQQNKIILSEIQGFLNADLIVYKICQACQN